MKKIKFDKKDFLFLLFLIIILILTYNIGIYNAIKINEYYNLNYNFLSGTFSIKKINATISSCVNLTLLNGTKYFVCET